MSDQVYGLIIGSPQSCVYKSQSLIGIFLLQRRRHLVGTFVYAVHFESTGLLFASKSWKSYCEFDAPSALIFWPILPFVEKSKTMLNCNIFFSDIQHPCLKEVLIINLLSTKRNYRARVLLLGLWGLP